MAKTKKPRQGPVDSAMEKTARQREAFYRALQQYRGLALIRVEYDGYGDSGQIESIEYLNKKGKPIDCSLLDGAVDDYVCGLLPDGWEDNAGAFGTVEIDVVKRRARFVHNDRFEDAYTTEFEDQ